jgi:hypothetical protein
MLPRAGQATLENLFRFHKDPSMVEWWKRQRHLRQVTMELFQQTHVEDVVELSSRW